MNVTIGDRINKRRLEKSMTLEELGKKAGVSKVTIHKYEANIITNIPSDRIEAMAKALEVSPAYLMGWSDNTEDIDISKIPGVTKLTKLKKIPILGTIACGTPIFAEENIDGYFIADKNIKADFSVKAKGDSMIDIGIHDGDLIFLRQQPVLENGEIGAVLIDNEATLKKVYINDNEMILQPCNKNYPPIVVKGGDIKIMGKLVGYYHNMEK